MRRGLTSQGQDQLISLRSSGVKSSRSFLSPALYLMRALQQSKMALKRLNAIPRKDSSKPAN